MTPSLLKTLLVSLVATTAAALPQQQPNIVKREVLDEPAPLSPLPNATVGISASTKNGTNTSSALHSCTTSFLSPSLAPSSIFVGLANSTENYIRQPNQTAEVNPANRTLFNFHVPPFWPPPSFNSSSGLCALQFRLPVCDNLPNGYPCFDWASGHAQQEAEGGGMRIIQKPDEVKEWQGAEVVGVEEGMVTTAGVFKCPAINQLGKGNETVLDWIAESVNDFALDFVQAGGSSGYADGIGMFIVACA